MSKHGNRYVAEFRRQMVELVRAGRGPEELAREFEPLGPDDPELGEPGGSRRGSQAERSDE